MDWQVRAEQLTEFLWQRGIRDERVLAQVARIPRHLFVPDASLEDAYADHAFTIGEGQTISQPYIVAMMTEAAQLQPSDHVLEIGTGSGYQTAILAPLCQTVVTIERLTTLSDRARDVWRRLPQSLDHVRSLVGDGSVGYPAGAPYDAILVTAGAPTIPEAYGEQLAMGGRLIIPVGNEDHQELLCLTRTQRGFSSRKLCDCRFVKLRGAEAWPAETTPTSPGDHA